MNIYAPSLVAIASELQDDKWYTIGDIIDMNIIRTMYGNNTHRKHMYRLIKRGKIKARKQRIGKTNAVFYRISGRSIKNYLLKNIFNQSTYNPLI